MQVTFPQVMWLILLALIAIWCVSHEHASLGFAIYAIGSFLPLVLLHVFQRIGWIKH